MTNEDELRDYLELVAANLRRTRGCLREVEEKYAGPVAIVGLGTCALTTWRRGDRGGAAAAGWRYQVTWLPAADPGPAALPGTWLLVAPDQRRFRAMVTQCAAAMTARGARVDTLLVDCAAISWDILAGLLESALTGESLAGVVSFLALSEPPGPGGQADGQLASAAGPAGTLALVQALGGAGITAPLWMLTRDAAVGAPMAGDAAAGDAAAGDGKVSDMAVSGPVVSGPVAARPVAGEPAHPGLWGAGGPGGLPAELGARAAALLCAGLPGWDADLAATGPASRRRGRRRAKPVLAWPAEWSANADRERLQAVNEAAGAPAQG